MTVKQLREFIDWYTDPKQLGHSENDSVMFCDDGMSPEYVDVNAVSSVYSRVVKPAIVEERYEIDAETGEIDYSKKPVPYQIEAPEYKQENILMLIPDYKPE